MLLPVLLLVLLLPLTRGKAEDWRATIRTAVIYAVQLLLLLLLPPPLLLLWKRKVFCTQPRRTCTFHVATTLILPQITVFERISRLSLHDHRFCGVVCAAAAANMHSPTGSIFGRIAVSVQRADMCIGSSGASR
jgi:hypothetical protein